MSTEEVAPAAEETVLVVVLDDLVNPNHTPVFAGVQPQEVAVSTVEAFPSKFQLVGDEPAEPTEEEAVAAAIEYAAWEEAAVYAQAIEDEAAAAAIEYAAWEEAAVYAQAIEDEAAAAKETATAKTGKTTRKG